MCARCVLSGRLARRRTASDCSYFVLLRGTDECAVSSAPRRLTSTPDVGILCGVRIHSVAFLLCLSLAACQRASSGATVPSSAGEAGYAERYPGSVENANTRLSMQEQTAREGFGKFAGYPDQ